MSRAVVEGCLELVSRECNLVRKSKPKKRKIYTTRYGKKVGSNPVPERRGTRFRMIWVRHFNFHYKFCGKFYILYFLILAIECEIKCMKNKYGII